jgi:hypothetical protein
MTEEEQAVGKMRQEYVQWLEEMGDVSDDRLFRVYDSLGIQYDPIEDTPDPAALVAAIESADYTTLYATGPILFKATRSHSHSLVLNVGETPTFDKGGRATLAATVAEQVFAAEVARLEVAAHHKARVRQLRIPRG